MLSLLPVLVAIAQSPVEAAANELDTVSLHCLWTAYIDPQLFDDAKLSDTMVGELGTIPHGPWVRCELIAILNGEPDETRIVIERTAEGAEKSRGYYGLGGMEYSKTERVLDTSGRVTRLVHTNSGSRYSWTYAYDAQSRLTTITSEPYENSRGSWADQEGIFTYEYSATGAPRLLRLTRKSKDAQTIGHQTFVYDAQGRLEGIVQQLCETCPEAQLCRIARDASGAISEIHRLDGGVTTLATEPCGANTLRKRTTSEPNGVGESTSWELVSPTGALLRSDYFHTKPGDPRFWFVISEYDGAGRMIRKTNAGKDPHELRYEYTDDEHGNWTERRQSSFGVNAPYEHAYHSERWLGIRRKIQYH